MSQLIWFFDEPTIMFCTKHQCIAFNYNNYDGLKCAQPGCTEDMWVEFECDPVELSMAEEKARAHGPLILDMSHTYGKNTGD